MNDEQKKLEVYSFLTGVEANASVSLLNLFAVGGTYAVGPEQFSMDAGYATSFDDFSLVTELAFGGNYSILSK